MKADAPTRNPSRRDTAKLGLLFAILYFVQSAGEPVAGLVAQPVRSLMRSWGESPATIATFAALVSLPWSLKPLYGLLSDLVPLAGYRRRSYLILTSGLATASFVALYLLRPGAGSATLLLVLLIVPTVSLAFGDVLVDALMVEKGQPTGTTGILQSVQWAASYTATLLIGVLGGYLSQRGMQLEAFLVVAALCLLTLVLSWRFVTEERHRPGESFRETLEGLKAAASSRTLLAIAAFLFLWSLDPLSTTIVYLHTTVHLGLSEQFFGITISVLAIGCIVASVAYAFYCRRVSPAALAHAAILLGALSQAAYWTMEGRVSAIVVHVIVGFTWMTGSLIQLDLAARICPPKAAATVFAVLMALTNLASSLGEWLGGAWYESLLASMSGSAAFATMVGFGVAAKLSCWLLYVIMPRGMALREVLVQSSSDRSGGEGGLRP
ncbi:MAG TPA: MFS transporter [Thermoanaerobaculia bacterium]|nr:MFS transporter [Thermoanaerobaculia bacterium]